MAKFYLYQLLHTITRSLFRVKSHLLVVLIMMLFLCFFFFLSVFFVSFFFKCVFVSFKVIE